MLKVTYNGNFEEQPITEVFCNFMETALAQDPDVMYCDADLMALIGMRDLWKQYPDRVLNSGIQESNMIGVGAGLSALGFKPYVHSFACFVTRRAFDQIFISGAYSGNTMHIIGTEPGIKQDFNGGTHMTFEDVALMRSIPHMHIFDITDNVMLRSVLEQTKDMEGMFYYRVPMAEIKKVYSDDSQMKVGKGNVLCEGTDATIIACGAIVTAENATISGGLGEAVSRFTSENCPVYMRHVAVQDEFGEVGPESYLFKRYGFTAENLVKQVKEVIAQKTK